MKGLLEQINTWFEQGRAVALATVIKTWGSSPRPAGAMMAISDQGEIYGSVSGGCVESAVIDGALQVIKDGISQRLRFGVADEEAWEVGLSCGGEIEVFVREFTPSPLQYWQEAADQDQRFCIALVIESGKNNSGLDWIVFENGEVVQIPSSPTIPDEVKELAVAASIQGKNSLLTLESAKTEEVFLQIVDPPKQLILVGGVHIAIPLTSLANTLGFDVTVIDPRRLFGSSDRFPAVKELLQEWPQEAFKKLKITPSTAIVMLTHDPKIDDPALQIALESTAFYIGALGSKKTHQKRIDRLTEQGVASESLNRIFAPVGLDLGASSPEEIALAVMAEIVQVWHQRG
jgi:xanthine dehydrogenase accessory factor